MDASLEVDGTGRLGDYTVGDEQCGAIDGLTKGGGGASSLEDSDNSMLVSTLGSIVTWTREGVEIVQVGDRGGVSNCVGTTICELVRP